MCAGTIKGNNPSKVSIYKDKNTTLYLFPLEILE